MAYRVLLVEDEENLLKTIRLNLELEGYSVISAITGKQAIKEFKVQRFDIVVLDVMLPEINGFDVCQAIRLENKEIPILFLTAKSSSDEKVKGLKLGADDYITKPFNLEEFLLRVQNLLKRSSKRESLTSTDDVFTFGGNTIDFNTYEITNVKGEKVQLSKKELLLAKLLIERKNEVVSREKILEVVWGYDVYPSTRTIDNYILSLRKHFEKDPRDPQYFHSIRSVGYKFTDSI